MLQPLAQRLSLPNRPTNRRIAELTPIAVAVSTAATRCGTTGCPFRSPIGRKKIAKRFIAGCWVSVRQPNESRQGRQNMISPAKGFFRPCGALEMARRGYPPLKLTRWAIFGCPCGTLTMHLELRSEVDTVDSDGEPPHVQRKIRAPRQQRPTNPGSGKGLEFPNPIKPFISSGLRTKTAQGFGNPPVVR